jgi:hypothetical protein
VARSSVTPARRATSGRSASRAARGRVEQRADEREREDVPELERAERVQERNGGYRGRAGEIAGDARAPVPDGVGDRTAEESPERKWKRREERRDSRSGDASGRDEDEPRDRNRRDHVAEERDGVGTDEGRER